MGMMDRLIGMGSTVTAVGNAATGISEVFTQNQTRRMELDEEAYARAMSEHGAEFASPAHTGWDSVMNGLNRLPRPLLTLGTIGLFVYAMVEPVGFSARMQGLALVPEPLWWLMGAIVSFYFGAREAHYFRTRVWPQTTVRQTTVATGAVATEVGDPLASALGEAMSGPVTGGRVAGEQAGQDRFPDNAALSEWAAARG